MRELLAVWLAVLSPVLCCTQLSWHTCAACKGCWLEDTRHVHAGAATLCCWIGAFRLVLPAAMRATVPTVPALVPPLLPPAAL